MERCRRVEPNAIGSYRALRFVAVSGAHLLWALDWQDRFGIKSARPCQAALLPHSLGSYSRTTSSTLTPDPQIQMRLWGRPRERLRVCAGGRERPIPRPYRGPPPPPPFPTSRSALRSRARPPAIFVVFVGSRQSTFGPIRNTRKLHDRAPRPPVVSLGSCVRLRSRLVPPQCNTHTSAELIVSHPHRPLPKKKP